jgi:hypothetical protein
LRWVIPPEGAKNLQECSRNIGEHKTQLDCTGFHRNSQDFGSDAKGVDKGASAHQNREGGEQGCSPRREGEGPEVAGAQTETVAAGGRRSPAGERKLPAGQREGLARENREPLARSGWRPFFKTRYGRTGQSTVPVRCTPDSAQENGFLARGCQCTGHCTVQCPVHTGLSGEPRQRGVWKILNFSI